MTTILLFWLAFVPIQFTEAGKAKLEKMVADRDALTREWKQSEGEKSGIFGNRTKKDMIKTNEWLERIIAKDNLIMDELRLINSIETTTAVQTGDDYKSIAFKQEQDIQKLKRALAERDDQIAQKKEERRTFEWISFILFIVSGALAYWVYKLKSS